jgi:homocysteine S-methyltransferase
MEPSWDAFKDLESLLQTNFVAMDGAMGTEVSRRTGVGGISALQLDVSDVVREVHASYINAGARLIITNTYATNRNVLSVYGIPERTPTAIEKAVEDARAASQIATVDHRTWVAGSLSTHPPDQSDDCGVNSYPEPEVEARAYFEAAGCLAAAGVDVIFLEMMKDTVHSQRAIAAAASTGLPFFLGISTILRPNGSVKLRGWRSEQGKEDFTKDVVDSWLATAGPGLVGLNVMHTTHEAVLPTLLLLRSWGYTGILGVYPDHGHWLATSNEWVREPLTTEKAREYQLSWTTDAGVRMIGGCCGLGVEYVRDVANFLAKLNQSSAETGKKE